MRRRLTLLVVGALAAATVTLLPSPAQAVVVTDGGLIQPGVATTALVGPDDLATYQLQVPAGARVTLTASSVPADMPVSTSLVWTADPFGPSSGSTMTALDPATWFSQFPQRQDVSVPATATLRLACGDCLPSGTTPVPPRPVTFTVHYAVDIVQAVSPGDVVTLHLTDVGQQARLTVPDPGQVSVWVESESLTSSIPLPGSAKLQIRDGDTFGPVLFESPPGHFCCGSSTTVVVDPVSAGVGDVVVRVNVAPAGAPFLHLGSPDPADLLVFTPGSTASAFFEAETGTRTLVHVTNPQFQTDGAVGGSMTLDLLVPGRPDVRLGTITSGSPATFPVEPALPEHTGATLRVTSVGTSTGSLQLRVRHDPGPGTPLPLGTSTLSVPAGTARSVYGFDVTAGHPVEVYLGPATYSDPATTSSPAPLVSEFGEPAGNFVLTTSGTSSGTVFGAGHYDLLVEGVPGSDVTASITLVAARTVSVPGTPPVDRDVTLSAPGENQEIVVPAPAGQAFLVTVTDVSLTGAPDGQPQATLTIGQPDGSNIGLPPLFSGGSQFLEVPPSQTTGSLRVLVDGNGFATGTVHVTVLAPPTVTGTLPADTPTTITVGERGAVARYTFDATAGDSFAFDIDGPALTSSGFPFENLSLLRPDGTVYAATSIFNGSRSWIDPAQLDATGTWTLLVDPSEDTTGSVTVTRITPVVVTRAVTPGRLTTVSFTHPGEVQRLTFTGRAGQRPVIGFTDAGVIPRVQLVRSDGLVTMDNSGAAFNPFMEAPVLDSSGTWTVVIDPDEFATGSIGVTVTLLTDPVTAVVSGQRTTTAFVAGQNPTFTVQAKAGRRIGFAVNRTVYAQDFGSFVRIVRPDGSTAFSGPLQPGNWFEMPDLTDVAGRWRVVLDPGGTTSGRVTSTVWVSQDQVVTGRLGKTTGVTVTTPGQQVALPFDVTTTKYLKYSVTGSTVPAPGLLVRLVTPFGTDWATIFVPPGTDSAGTVFVPLVFSGRWSLVVDPLDGGTGKAKVAFSLVDQAF